MTDPKTYTVRLVDGSRIGPVGIRTVKELLLRGEVVAEDREALVSEIFASLSESPGLLEQLAKGDTAPGENPAAFHSLDILEGIPPTMVFVNEENEATQSGQLEEVPFPRLLYFFHTRQSSGCLALHDPSGESTSIYFSRGTVEQVLRSSGQDELYTRLVEKGHCSTEQLQEAARRCQSSGGQLSDHLVAMRFVDPHALLNVMQELFIANLLSCFSLREGPYIFHPNASPKQATVPHSIDLFPLILQGIEAHYPLERLQWTLEPYYNARVEKGENPYIPFEQLRLSPRQTRMFHTIERANTLWELIEKSQSMGIADELASHQFLFYLAQLELLLFDNHTLGARLSEKVNLLEAHKD